MAPNKTCEPCGNTQMARFLSSIPNQSLKHCLIPNLKASWILTQSQNRSTNHSNGYRLNRTLNLNSTQMNHYCFRPLNNRAPQCGTTHFA